MDIYDFLTVLGLCLLGVGLGWQFGPATALMVVGTVVFGLGVVGAYNKGQQAPQEDADE